MKIGNKERSVKFGLNQSILYCELRGISITQMNADFSRLVAGGNGSEIRDLIWSALKDGARFNKEEFDHDNFDVGDWMETIEEGELAKFLDELVESMPKSKKVTKKKG